MDETTSLRYKGTGIDTIYLNFGKAFDLVPHDILI